ncbi:HAD family hydrolase [Spiroplasma endosymbiont of Crioceris asparagi]|uniref:HAD family hydrolase n=1 Tax=Spiroplasma endosymbiont of Crioceris asparagi TaxID=3066286 RepID=UPI0030CD78E3
MKFKLLLIDMDGTCHTPGGGIIKSNIEPIKQAHDAGVIVVFATGRAPFAEINELEKHGFYQDGYYLAALNGSWIIDLKDQTTLEKNLISAQNVNSVINVIKTKQPDIDFFAYSEDPMENYIYNKGPLTLMEFEKKFIDRNSKLINIMDFENFKSCFKFLLRNSNENFHQEISKYDIEIHWEPGRTAEINRAGIHKGFAVNYFMKKFNINKDEIIAMGDGPNDVSMLKVVTHGVVPSNACDSAKANAFEISKYSYQEGFVGKIINKYIFNKGE